MNRAEQEAHFRKVAPGYMAQLLADFPAAKPQDAAAVFGNLGFESKGLTDDQEDKPLVAGSRGGRNWAQWTGPRRRAFEAYCKRTGKDPDGDGAAYAFLFLELSGIEGTESHALPRTIKAVGLEAKVEAFCDGYLRPDPRYKHMDGRIAWARIALNAYATGPAVGGVVPTRPVDTQLPAPPDAPFRPSPAVPPAKPELEGSGLGWGFWFALILIMVAAVTGLALFWRF